MRLTFALLWIVLVAAIATANTLTVQSAADSLDDSSTQCTLRKAIINANTNTAVHPSCAAGGEDDVIVFNTTGGGTGRITITLAIPGAGEDAAQTGDLDITQNLFISGDGETVDGASLDRVFHVLNNTVATIKDLWIRNGSTSSAGGGAILVDGASLDLRNVTISGSSTTGNGGALRIINSGYVTMTNCTISGNTAAGNGGAISVESGGFLQLINCTITGNSSGVYNNGGTVTLVNTIVAGNGPSAHPNLDGTFSSSGYNIVGSLGTTAGNPNLTATTGDQIGVNDSLLNFGPLQDNGHFVPTIALGAGSIAIDKGNSSGSTTDERGLPRPFDDPAIPNAPGGDGSDVGAFEVQVALAPPNTPPVAVDDSATVAEDSGANTIDVLANDSDPDGDTLTITGVTQGAHGSVTNNGTSVAYTPAHDFAGGDSFTYTVSDGHGNSATATVHVTVFDVPPVAHPDSYSMNQDTTLTVAAPGVLGNDTDPDIGSDIIRAVLASGVSHGTLALNADGSFVYTPAPHFAGLDGFTYRANDGIADSNTAAVTIHIADTEPPVITTSLATTSLWPPNHTMVNVGFTFSATDNVAVASTSVGIFSNEDDLAQGSGDQSPDALDIGSGTLRLRAERSGTGSGRVYLIIVTAADTSANTSHACLTVTVSKSQSAADLLSVAQQAAAAGAQCTATGLPPAGYFVVGDGPVVGPKQ